jgi:hypothetical protein
MEPPFSFQALDEATGTFPEVPLLDIGVPGGLQVVVHSKAHQLFEFGILWAGSGFPMPPP